MATFTRNVKGKYVSNANIFSLYFGEKSFLLEDELNEMQYQLMDRQSFIVDSMLSNAGPISDYTIHTGDYPNVFYLDAVVEDQNQDFMFTMHGEYLPIGGNSVPNQPSEITSNSNRLVVGLNPCTVDRYDLVILETWYEVRSFSDGFTLFGGEATPALTNYDILDPRVNTETSRRYQYRWRVRVIENQSSMSGVTAFNYQGQDTGFVYRNYGSHYMAFPPGPIYAPNGDYVTDGSIHTIPLFVVHRNPTNALIQMTDIQVLMQTATIKDSMISNNIARTANVYSKTESDALYVAQNAPNNSISGDLTVGGILSIGGSATITGDATVDGNLVVKGTTTTIDSTQITMEDSTITLNSGQNISTTLYAGISVDRSLASEANVQLRWNESKKDWELTNDGTNFYRLLDYRDYNNGILNNFAINANNQLTWNGSLVGAVQANGTLQANLNSDMLDGLRASNGSGQIPINNGTVNTNLNADLLDGQHGSYYATDSLVVHKAGDTMSGNLNMQGNQIQFQGTTDSGTAGVALTDYGYIFGEHDSGAETSRLVISVGDNATDSIVLRTSNTGDGTGGTTVNTVTVNHNAITFALTPNVNGNQMWHAGNMGAGSGLNADLLDSLNSTQFVRIDAANTMSADINMNSHNLNNAVINTATSISFVNNFMLKALDTNYLYLKDANNTVFKSLSLGGLNLNSGNISGVSYIYGQAGTIAQSTDAWLRFNNDGSHTSGVYFGSSITRTDGQFQVGPNGQYFQAASSGTNVYNNIGFTGGNRQISFGTNIVAATGAVGSISYAAKPNTTQNTRLTIGNAGGLAGDDVYITAGAAGNGQVVMSAAQTIHNGQVLGNSFLAAEGTGMAGTVGFSFQNDGNLDTGMFSPSDGDLHLYSNNVDVMELTTSGITNKVATTMSNTLTTSSTVTMNSTVTSNSKLACAANSRFVLPVGTNLY